MSRERVDDPLAIGILLALGSSVAHAWWNASAKRLAPEGVAGLWTFTAASFVLLGPVCVVVLVRDPGAWNLPVFGAACVSGAMHAGYGALLQASFRRFDLTEIYPLSRGLAPVLVALTGLVLLGQTLSAWQWGGVILIAAALAVAGLSTGARRTASGTAGTSGAARWSVAIATATTAYTCWDGWAVLSLHAEPVVFYGLGGLLQFVVLTALARGGIRRAPAIARRWPGRVMLLGALVPTSYLLSLVAVRYAPVAVVASVRGMSVLWATLIGIAALGEPMTRLRAVTVGVALAAIVVMAMG